MWAELFYYFTKTKGTLAQKTGHKSEMASYMTRYRSSKKTWDLHFKQCHKWIWQFVNEYPERRGRLFILGAGEMFDVPSEIFSLFSEVFALDIVKTSRVCEISKIYQHVKFLEFDLSGFFKKEIFPQILDSDLVISMNVLSQLPLMPIFYLEKKKKSDLEMEELGAKIIREHLIFLNSINALLIADVDWRINNELYDPYFNVTWIAPISQWQWQLAAAHSNTVGVWNTKGFFSPKELKEFPL
jgi:hypothetical protein